MNKDVHILRLMLCAVLFLSLSLTFGQNLRRPTPQFTAPCASASFNTFNVRFQWDGPLVNSDNVFILELSDETGSFSNAVQLASDNTQNTTFDFIFNFAFPSDIRGDNYRVRVRSTSPALTSPESDAFPAYFLNVDQNLTITGFGSGIVAVCDGSSTTLEVLNFPGEPAYRWFRNRNPIPIPGETGSTLEVTQPGFYFAEVDYGDFCSGSTFSNETEVIMNPVNNIAINGPANVELCPGFTYQLEANVNSTALTYRWFKDGVLINTPGFVPTISVDPANPAGTYTLETTTNNSAACVEVSAPVVITVPNLNVTVSQPSNVLLLPGDSIDLDITTTADNPSYAWFRDGSLLSGETNSTLTVINPGVYRGRVTQGTGCIVDEFTTDVTVELPQSINITVAPQGAYSECDQTSTILEVNTIQAVTTSGNTIDVKTQLINNFSYQWLKANTPITGETGNTLTISDASLNDLYSLRATISSFNIVSNDFDVKLRIDETVTISSDGQISCDGSSLINISSDVTDASYTYEWFRDNILIASETSPTLATNLAGAYRLGVTAFGCTVFSNEIIISPFDSSIVTVDAPEVIVIPEGSFRIVTASGADNYQWFNEENIEISSSASVTLSEEGQYVLRAFVGTCQVIRRFTVQFQDSFAVPNVISPNSDGINDLWIIPNRFAFNPDIEVIIYDPNGALVFRANGYQNNWPESNLTYSLAKPIFYYKIISRENEVLKQGTITLIR
ncbi:gliding motility-associated C-terminal domain-containing protein [Flavobacteriaceae bacterium R38]|nr:gliding motility-associated C-terminal domain-containing protein [Flavobacteriaceae bacterium R38]